MVVRRLLLLLLLVLRRYCYLYHSEKKGRVVVFFFSAKMHTSPSFVRGSSHGPPRSPSVVFLTDCSHLDKIWAWRELNRNVFSDVAVSPRNRCRVSSRSRVVDKPEESCGQFGETLPYRAYGTLRRCFKGSS